MILFIPIFIVALFLLNIYYLIKVKEFIDIWRNDSVASGLLSPPLGSVFSNRGVSSIVMKGASLFSRNELVGDRLRGISRHIIMLIYIIVLSFMALIFLFLYYSK